MRLGIFGGSFDPVHYGHLILAETCRESCELDEVWLIPNAQPPHKPTRQLTPARQRLEMLELAVAGNSQLVASSLEVDRGGLSYTVETLSEVQSRFPRAELFFLFGGDALRDLATWRDPERICRLATPLVVARAGSPAPDLEVLRGFLDRQEWDRVQNSVVDMPLIDISSTDLRTRVQTGRSIRFRTPHAVEVYIASQRLYR